MKKAEKKKAPVPVGRALVAKRLIQGVGRSAGRASILLPLTAQATRQAVEELVEGRFAPATKELSHDVALHGPPEAIEVTVGPHGRIGIHQNVEQSHAPFVERRLAASEDEIQRERHVLHMLRRIVPRAIHERSELGNGAGFVHGAEQIAGLDEEPDGAAVLQFAVPAELHQTGALEHHRIRADMVMRHTLGIAKDLFLLVPAVRPLGIADDVDVVVSPREIEAVTTAPSQHQDLAAAAVSTAAVEAGDDVTRTQVEHLAGNRLMGLGHGKTSSCG